MPITRRQVTVGISSIHIASEAPAYIYLPAHCRQFLVADGLGSQELLFSAHLRKYAFYSCILFCLPHVRTHLLEMMAGMGTPRTEEQGQDYLQTYPAWQTSQPNIHEITTSVLVLAIAECPIFYILCRQKTLRERASYAVPLRLPST